MMTMKHYDIINRIFRVLHLLYTGDERRDSVRGIIRDILLPWEVVALQKCPVCLVSYTLHGWRAILAKARLDRCPCGARTRPRTDEELDNLFKWAYLESVEKECKE